MRDFLVQKSLKTSVYVDTPCFFLQGVSYVLINEYLAKAFFKVNGTRAFILTEAGGQSAENLADSFSPPSQLRQLTKPNREERLENLACLPLFLGRILSSFPEF